MPTLIGPGSGLSLRPLAPGRRRIWDIYFFKREIVHSELQSALSVSFWAAAVTYLLVGSLRAFTLVPATFPLLIAIPFFDP